MERRWRVVYSRNGEKFFLDLGKAKVFARDYEDSIIQDCIYGLNHCVTRYHVRNGRVNKTS